MPKWLELQFEIDYWFYILNKMNRELKEEIANHKRIAKKFFLIAELWCIKVKALEKQLKQ